MKVDPAVFLNQVVVFFRYGAIVGFLVATTLLINLNNKAYTNVFKSNSKTYFWFFLLLSIIPLLAFIYVFNLLFGKLTLASGLK